MKIKAIQLSKFLSKTDSLYKNIIISAARARQIIDERYEKLAIEEDIEDSDQLDNLIEELDFNEEKPISIAVNEFMENELEWKKAEEMVNEQ